MVKLAAFSIMWLCFTAQAATAAIVFTLSQDPSTPGPIPLGGSAIFQVSIASNAGTVTDLSGISFAVAANDPGFTGAVTTGGRFVAGSNILFAPNGSFTFNFPSSLQVFGANSGATFTVTDTPRLVATLTLDTNGAIADSYFLSMSGQVALDSTFTSIASVAAEPLSYRIQVSAVPEPGSLTLLLTGVGLASIGRYRRSR